jgi:hypothetical protein
VVPHPKWDRLLDHQVIKDCVEWRYMVDDHNTSKQIPHRAGGWEKLYYIPSRNNTEQRRRVHFKVREAALQAATLELQSMNQ